MVCLHCLRAAFSVPCSCMTYALHILASRNDPVAARNVNQAVNGMLELLEDYRAARAALVPVRTSGAQSQRQSHYHASDKDSETVDTQVEIGNRKISFAQLLFRDT